MLFRAKQIAPPKDWASFEDLCHALFKKVWEDPIAQKNGRRGQPQCGVDVFGSFNVDRSSYCGVQCKGKDTNYGSKATHDELVAEIAKAEKFNPALEHWIFATTAPVDGRLQELARVQSTQRNKHGLFVVDVLGWEEIQALMAGHPNVIEEFYPEHTDHIPQVVEALKTLPSIDAKLAGLMDSHRAQPRLAAAIRPSEGKWEAISFESDRGLGPALLGRPMGPSDATSCPRLVEADMLALQLRIAFSARLMGEPGAGKSICSYQVARDYANAGFEVLRLSDAQAETIDPPASSSGKRFLFIDDAHLMEPTKLSRLEESAGPNLMVLSAHAWVERSDLERGSVTLNAKRAVHTIASGFRADLPRTLASVRIADDRIGERMMDEDLNVRIDRAEETADRPWQFCFILGGGWRRSKQAAEAAHNAGVDLVLAAVSTRQLASRDAIARLEDIVPMCEAAKISREALERHLEWLERERLILGFADCRTPHQRFASVVLNQILVGQDYEGRQRIGRMIDAALIDPQYPLAGLRTLLHEIRFGIGQYRWSRLPQRSAIEHLARRCWQAQGKERGVAALALSELWRFLDDGSCVVIQPYAETFSRWISTPDDGAYGFAHLLNELGDEARRIAEMVFAGVKATSVARAYSKVSLESACGLADLMRTLCSLDDGPWKEKMKAKVDRSLLFRFANDERFQEEPYVFGRFCCSVACWDEDLALEMAERFIPRAQAVFRRDPILGFRELSHVFFMPVLRVFDPLEIYVGKLKPNRRRWSVARRICKAIDPTTLAAQLDSVRIRDFQSAAGLLHFLFRCAPKKYDGVVGQLDWDKLHWEIGQGWTNPSHETEVILSMLSLSETTRQLVSDFIALRAGRIEKMPPRLVLLAPRVGTEHVKAGKRLRLAEFDHVEWEIGALALSLIGEDQPELVAQAVRPFVDDIAKGIANYHRNHADEAEFLIRMLIEMAPDVWEDVLLALDAEVAEESLANCLVEGRGHRRAAALVVDSAQEVGGHIGQMARRLRKRFPRASVPLETPPRYLARRRRRSRRRK